MSKLESRNSFAAISVLILVPLLIMSSSLISVSFAPAAEGKVSGIAKHENSTSKKEDGTALKSGAIGSGTVKINTNIYPQSDCGRDFMSPKKYCPNNSDMVFRLLVQQGSTSFYDQRFNGSPNTIIIPVPVAVSGKTDYQAMFVSSNIIDRDSRENGYWGLGDESVKVCSGELENGATALCTLNMYWNWYSR